MQHWAKISEFEPKYTDNSKLYLARIHLQKIFGENIKTLRLHFEYSLDKKQQHDKHALYPAILVNVPLISL